MKKKYIYYGVVVSSMFVLLYPYIDNYIIYTNSSISVFIEDFIFKVRVIICVSIVLHFILSCVVFRKDKLTDKIAYITKGFLIGTISSIILLIILSYAHMLYNIIIINYVNKIDKKIVHTMTYFYTNKYIPFCSIERLEIDLKRFFIVFVYLILNISVAHIFTVRKHIKELEE